MMDLRLIKIKPPVRVRRPIWLKGPRDLRQGSGWGLLFVNCWAEGNTGLTAWYRQWAARRGFPTRRADIINKNRLRQPESNKTDIHL